MGGGARGGGLRMSDLDWLSILLSHEPVHLRHGFEDEGLGMPWTKAKFQVWGAPRGIEGVQVCARVCVCVCVRVRACHLYTKS